MSQQQNPALAQVLDALTRIRAPLSTSEYDLHALVAEALARGGVPCRHEAALAPRCRADFLCGRVAVEIKRAKPPRARLIAQLTRYLQSDAVDALVLVAERGVELPDTLCAKPVRVVSLSKLFGVAADGAGAPAINTFAAAGAAPAIIDGGTCQILSVPPYLSLAPGGERVYGTLSYNARGKCWVIKGEPCVTELAKRLFPGSAGSRRGEARFAAHRRLVGEVHWLMLRYPLAVRAQDEARWERALEEARAYARAREAARRAPQFLTPPAGTFCGELRPFQQAGLSFLAVNERALLADEMGLGKTVQALACLALKQAFPALVIVPAHLVRNWEREIARFLRVSGRAPRVHVLRGLTPYPLPEADVYLMHYLLLRGWKTVLPGIPFRAVIFDEIQELRHGGTEKYSAASLVAGACERVMGLSGTPIYNRGGEIWNVVNILDYHFLGDFDSFTREWCYGYGNNVVLKPELLGEHLRREGMMLRRTKKEVLPELPDKRRLVQEIDADDALYRRLMAPTLDKLRLWREDTAMTRSERALLEDQISQGERQATGLAKAGYVCQFVRALLENGEAVLLFAHHHAVMDAYARELKAFRPAFITGRETAAKKDAAQERFMEGRTNLCCVSLRAASGLNLQRATCVVFGELDWSPAVHSQAEDRAHRMGQRDSLLCYYLVSPRGSDADMQEALGLKISQFVGLMGDAPETPEAAAASASLARAHVESLVRRLRDAQ